jgi:hypothetical protein
MWMKGGCNWLRMEPAASFGFSDAHPLASILPEGYLVIYLIN